MRQRFIDLVEDGMRATGASRASTLEQVARGLFLAVATALDLPADYRLT